MWIRLRWRSMAALGRPVVPEVEERWQTSSGLASRRSLSTASGCFLRCSRPRSRTSAKERSQGSL